MAQSDTTIGALKHLSTFARCTGDTMAKNTVAQGVVENINRKMGCHEDKQSNTTGFVWPRLRIDSGM